jgi:hypothetical protein
LSFNSIDSKGKINVYGPYCGNEEGESLFLEIDKNQSSTLYGFVNSGGDGFEYLSFFGTYQSI